MPIGNIRRRIGIDPSHQHEGDPTSFYHKQVDSYVTSIKNNTYHLLDSTMQDPLQKLTLPDGTIIFTVHRTIQDLTSVLLPPNDTHDTSKQHTNSHQYISNKIISSKSKNRNLLNTHRIAEFSPTKIIKSNIKRLVQKHNNKKHGAEEDNTIHFIPDHTTLKSSNPHNKHPLP